ncbi:hypothetical protein ACT2CR_00565 [Candidatus Vidania fulgoroideorum]
MIKSPIYKKYINKYITKLHNEYVIDFTYGLGKHFGILKNNNIFFSFEKDRKNFPNIKNNFIFNKCFSFFNKIKLKKNISLCLIDFGLSINQYKTNICFPNNKYYVWRYRYYLRFLSKYLLIKNIFNKERVDKYFKFKKKMSLKKSNIIKIYNNFIFLKKIITKIKIKGLIILFSFNSFENSLIKNFFKKTKFKLIKKMKIKKYFYYNKNIIFSILRIYQKYDNNI